MPWNELKQNKTKPPPTPKKGRGDSDSQDWAIFSESLRMSYNSSTGNGLQVEVNNNSK